MSSDSQATGRPPRRAQSASSTVLPDPAGAQTTTSPRASPSSSRTASRGRGTKPGRGRGTCSLVASRTSCPDTATPPQAAHPAARPAMASVAAGYDDCNRWLAAAAAARRTKRPQALCAARQKTERPPAKFGFDGCGSSVPRLRRDAADVGDVDQPAHPGPSALIAERNQPPVAARACNRRYGRRPYDGSLAAMPPRRGDLCGYAGPRGWPGAGEG